MTTKIWDRDMINDLLVRNDAAVERAMIRLYELQTQDEKSTDSTRVHNGQGFGSFYARRGSYYARWVQSGKRLSGHHLDAARKIALKHSRQLVDIANAPK